MIKFILLLLVGFAVYLFYNFCKSRTFVGKLKAIQYIRYDYHCAYSTAYFKVTLGKNDKLITLQMKKNFTDEYGVRLDSQVAQYIRSIKLDTDYMIEFSQGYITILGEHQDEIIDLTKQKFNSEEFYKNLKN